MTDAEALLRSIFKAAFLPKIDSLPAHFNRAIYTMCRTGIKAEIIAEMPHIAQITFQRRLLSKHSCVGAYKGQLISPTKHAMGIDWEELGWNDSTPNRSMMYYTRSPDPSTIIHESGHWIDDIHLSQNTTLIPGDAERIKVLKDSARQEYQRALYKIHGLMPLKIEHIAENYQSIPYSIWSKYAISSYALATYSEWIAESFTDFCCRMSLYGKWQSKRVICPATHELFEFALCKARVIAKDTNQGRITISQAATA